MSYRNTMLRPELKQLLASASCVDARTFCCRIVLAACVVSWANSAHADIKSFISLYNGKNPDMAIGILLGVEAGLIKANEILVRERKEPPLYCQPPRLKLAVIQIESMMEDQAQRDPSFARLSIEDGVTQLFIRTFPCARNASNRAGQPRK